MNRLYKKYCEVINYLIFGILTTFISIVSYYLLGLVLNLENNIIFIFTNIISWLIAVTFAYITNKKYVFKSNGNFLLEFIKFILSRIITLLIEVLGMYLLVKILNLNNMISKIFMQGLVIVLNYIFSKMMVFNICLKK